eukprot:TRINITY_DN1314_c0_g1_i1.p1 TRINITY_DN1314_c0_g1~~TRINITY_DN1314_c0_g1_i1.p1  ORF type:complete len:756 (+),score=209.29 TRINITY_DN1314_c0_g1_i1:252-2270(+)
MDEVGSDLVAAIVGNTLRYRKLFESAIDSLLPEPTVDIHSEDVFDVLQHQREELLRQAHQGEENAEIAVNALPPSLRRRFRVIFRPLVEKPLSVRQVSAKDVGHLVSLKAVVVRCTDVRPEVAVATYTCDQCGFEVYQEVVGMTFKRLNECPHCKETHGNGRLTMQTRGSKMVPFQQIRVQELSSQVPIGHIPRTMSVELRGEHLVRRIIPGDVVMIGGVFLPVPVTGFRAMHAGLIANTYLEAMFVEKMKASFADSSEDEEIDEEIAAHSDVYDKLARSIAPEIHGHEDVKKALLVQLAGGVTRTLGDGMRIRGDIHVCLMGDPGVAKSQLLRHITAISPRGIYTTGKGSSGVGLTAAILKDPITNEMVLEGGALVLADRGVCCIDEFDKMEESDRTSIHEVMEQQTVSIAKAGIQTTLNARASVLAAANPAYGRYNKRRTPSQNINMPAALLSRFDILFVLTDEADVDRDTSLARHITYVHQHGEAPSATDDDGESSVFSEKVIRAYIARARRFQPFVPRELSEYISSTYVQMRQSELERGQHAHSYTTARTFLSILRISQALARLRFSDQVEQMDIDEAIRLLQVSKSALDDSDEFGMGGVGLDAVSAIYSVIRDHALATGQETVTVSSILPKVLARGYTEAQLNQCLHEYEDINVFQMNMDRTEIRFV